MSRRSNNENNMSTRDEPPLPSTREHVLEIDSDTRQYLEKFISRLYKAGQPGTSRGERQDKNGEYISFKLAKFDPDKSLYSMVEWLREVNNIKNKLNIDDNIMILKVGEALQGKARRFYDGWRNLNRSWSNFENDLRAAFPDHVSYHTKLVRAANMKSSDFSSVTEYGLEKVQNLYRYYSELPWDRILSPVIGGITSSIIREELQLHQPKNQKELMLLLRHYDEEVETYRHLVKRFRLEDEAGKCLNCGETGHNGDQCRFEPPLAIATETNSDRAIELN